MLEAAIQVGIWIGFAVLLGSAILGNLAFYRLNRAVNKAYDIRHRIDPWSMVFPARSGTRQVLERIRLYKAAYGNGTYWKQLKLAYWIFGIGFALAMTSALCRNKF